MSDDAVEAGWGGALWKAADLVTPMAIRVAATLRVADHIAGGTRTAAELGALVGADVDALDRVLAHLVTVGVLTREGSGYGLSPVGEQLRDDDPGGVRAWVDLDGAIGRAELSFIHLLHTVRTGEAAFPRQYGAGFWDDLAADEVRSASFDALMGARLADDAGVVAAAYPWGDLGRLVDVGGGNGTVLIAILRAHPSLRGTVLDLALPVGNARRALVAAGVADRADACVGSFFDELPAGAGGYFLSGVLHDWDDERALTILRRCAAAAGSTGRVLVLEYFDLSGAGVNTEGDLRMLAYCSGRERTIEQMTNLAARAGLGLGLVHPAGRNSLLEFVAS